MGVAYLRLAAEQTPNAEGGAATVSSVTFDVPANSVEMNPNMTLLDRGDELRGAIGELPPLGAAAYSPEISVKSKLYPGNLGAFLLATCGSVTTVQGVAGPTVVDPDAVEIPAGVYRHVFAWKTADPPQSMQAYAAPPAGLFFKGQGVGIDEMSFAAEGGAWNVDLAMKALYWAIVADPTITPAFETVKPFLEGTMTLTWMAGSGTTKAFSFKINNGLETLKSFTTASLFPDLLQFADDAPYQKVTGTIDKLALDADDWAALIAGTTFAATIKLKHTQKVGVINYYPTLWIEMPACVLTAGTIEAIQNKRRHEAQYEWAGRVDVTTSKWATVTLCNGTAALATYA